MKFDFYHFLVHISDVIICLCLFTRVIRRYIDLMSVAMPISCQKMRYDAAQNWQLHVVWRKHLQRPTFLLVLSGRMFCA